MRIIKWPRPGGLVPPMWPTMVAPLGSVAVVARVLVLHSYCGPTPWHCAYMYFMLACYHHDCTAIAAIDNYKVTFSDLRDVLKLVASVSY